MSDEYSSLLSLAYVASDFVVAHLHMACIVASSTLREPSPLRSDSSAQASAMRMECQLYLEMSRCSKRSGRVSATCVSMRLRLESRKECEKAVPGLGPNKGVLFRCSRVYTGKAVSYCNIRQAALVLSCLMSGQ